jgi:hypothetical protein
MPERSSNSIQVRTIKSNEVNAKQHLERPLELREFLDKFESRNGRVLNLTTRILMLNRIATASVGQTTKRVGLFDRGASTQLKRTYLSEKLKRT